jgi:Domain of unknown function (DUF5615)
VSVRCLADEDLQAGIVDGLRSREPTVDILDVKTGGLRGKSDPDLLKLAAEEHRVLITHDRHTMTRHARERIGAGAQMTGVFILPQAPASVGSIIEWLLLVWTESEPEEWGDQIIFVSF